MNKFSLIKNLIKTINKQDRNHMWNIVFPKSSSTWLDSMIMKTALFKPELNKKRFWLIYERVLNNPVMSVKDVLLKRTNFLREVIESLVYKVDNLNKNTNFNIGKLGKGLDFFSKNEQDKIRHKLKFYKNIDFDMLGV